MDPDTRRLMLFAGGLGVVLVALVGASTLVGHRSGEIPVVAADTRPIREKPLNPGGLKIDGAENDVFSAGTDTANSRLAPASEKPDTAALRTVAEPPPPAIAEPAAPTALAPPLDPEARPAAIAGAPPAAKRAAAVAAAPAAKPVAAKPPSAEPHAAAVAHPAMVQLAALTSEDAAHAEWQQLAKRMPDLLNGRQPSYSRTERDGHTFWRVRTSGFADDAQARAFCEHVRAKGGGCSVAD